MSKLEEAKEILSSLKVPAKQQNGMCCCVLLAMANLTEEQIWGSAANNWIRIHGNYRRICAPFRAQLRVSVCWRYHRERLG